MLRSPTTLGITWTAPSLTGGAPFLDYRVSIAKSEEDFVIVQNLITSTKYKAEGLTTGVTYKFRIESHNSFGYSVYSDVLTLLCASKPDIPSAPTTVINDDIVIISWTEPNNQGSIITSYTI